MDTTQTPFLIVLAILLVCSALASASETALFGITHGQRAMLRRTNPKLSRIVESLLARPRELLTQVLLINMVVNVSYFIVTSILTINAESTLARVMISLGYSQPLSSSARSLPSSLLHQQQFCSFGSQAQCTW
ncbi:MAG: DUF21 domain-containing protein [Phycisphaerales bacterium]|nr:DUF21 domain-containing protein [Phycisphaerales bacterium]